MLIRLAYLTVINAFAMVRLLPMSDRDKDAEILALRQQITVLERQLGKVRPAFTAPDRAFLAALLQPLPRARPLSRERDGVPDARAAGSPAEVTSLWSAQVRQRTPPAQRHGSPRSRQAR
ncbi:hypothetical protein [Streptomyces sp. NPDC005507]|uniref:hypothetical protein n=1 Tax=Streptomyces sp. NPDC005507 TaxID=3154885 RepID=UPI0033B8D7EB